MHKHSESSFRLLGTSPLMETVRERIDQVARSSITVLLRGENGTGKELIARTIHEESARRGGPFIACALAGLPEGLLESELFGYERGAFTNAVQRKPGLVELARGGTLFLDEIGDLPLAMQVRLLRLLQERQYMPLGATRSVAADVRFIAATHRDLEAMVEAGSFRQDLYFRLNVVDIWAPPLRAHAEDIPELVRLQVEKVVTENARESVILDESAMQALCSEVWPGNVRELFHRVERLVVLAKEGRITGDDVRAERTGNQAERWADAVETRRSPHVSESGVDANLPVTPTPLADQLKRTERVALQRALAMAHGQKKLAAKLLGISRVTLYEKLELHALHERTPRAPRSSHLAVDAARAFSR